jgi:hypothetical protein
MSLFRRSPAQGEQKLHDQFVIRADSHGTIHEACWFCGETVEFDARHPTPDAAIVMVQPFGGGEAEHGVCHSACAERAKGSLAF